MPYDAVGPFANDIKDLVVATDDEGGHAVVHGGQGRLEGGDVGDGVWWVTGGDEDGDEEKRRRRGRERARRERGNVLSAVAIRQRLSRVEHVDGAGQASGASVLGELVAVVALFSFKCLHRLRPSLPARPLPPLHPSLAHCPRRYPPIPVPIRDARR